jgi:lysophospholipase L1-like esterase
LRYASGQAIVVCDGNSLTKGDFATSAAQSYPSVLATLPPISTNGTPVTNLGVSGQTAAQMLSSRVDVTAAYNAGKVCVLVAWELVNSIYNGRTPQQAVDDLLLYVSTVKSENPWHVAVCTQPPSYVNKLSDAGVLNQTTVDAMNADLNSANTKLRAQWAGTANRLIDMRYAGGPFDLANYTATTFDNTGLYHQEASGWRIHFNDSGYAAIAAIVANSLRQMPAR